MIPTLHAPEISTISGKNCELRAEKIELTFRGESFEVVGQYWFDPADGSDFTTALLSNVTQRLLHSAYREKHGIPFPEEITALREQYGMSARAMSKLLGLGTNQYRLYEDGEVPTKPIGKLIASLKTPKAFRQLLEGESEGIPAKKRATAIAKLDQLKLEKGKNFFMDSYLAVQQRFEQQSPNLNNGYRKPSLHRIAATIALLSVDIDLLFTVKLNKLLYYVDNLVFSTQGYGLTGLTYIAIPMGPVPDEYRDVFAAVSQDDIGALRINRPAKSVGDSGEQFEAYHASAKTIAEAKSIIVDPIHLKAIEEVRKAFGFMKTSDLVDFSHKEEEWISQHETCGRMAYRVRGAN